MKLLVYLMTEIVVLAYSCNVSNDYCVDPLVTAIISYEPRNLMKIIFYSMVPILIQLQDVL